ncbi:hypothetical protein RRF57_013031 [Xylaria bambusicola]|uniref:Uncharacterized protein n=1 Tax=Xylaria bambusicola TaxID=326684 RepID=A0AAN7V4V2_9PEZI
MMSPNSSSSRSNAILSPFSSYLASHNNSSFAFVRKSTRSSLNEWRAENSGKLVEFKLRSSASRAVDPRSLYIRHVVARWRQASSARYAVLAEARMPPRACFAGDDVAYVKQLKKKNENGHDV